MSKDIRNPYPQTADLDMISYPQSAALWIWIWASYPLDICGYPMDIKHNKCAKTRDLERYALFLCFLQYFLCNNIVMRISAEYPHPF
ncbi:hypothetical protein N7468_000107 [Penicillium chermesinum]|uniref:Uncharacterized protein n=1 Tax=Penicillium chermesinum TaxID=63820 RepID=A0A9W9PJM2_9EURO|nr:uncharacterized protein N7468_001324 [Penicillium chermesinum]XP_058335435.1 uncharacterized protein N7468_000107 [Penicillium chermesinum]KAJ5246341.1 hypothetical protein N7468_001324 [Penicillium chermesinum]KAJ5248656.1 hypothetical protein N7468_000107 [Penicillium chermesinum]